MPRSKITSREAFLLLGRYCKETGQPVVLTAVSAAAKVASSTTHAYMARARKDMEAEEGEVFEGAGGSTKDKTKATVNTPRHVARIIKSKPTSTVSTPKTSKELAGKTPNQKELADNVAGESVGDMSKGSRKGAQSPSRKRSAEDDADREGGRKKIKEEPDKGY